VRFLRNYQRISNEAVSTKLFIVERDKDSLFTLPDGRKVKTFEVPPGGMWRCDCHGEKGWLISLPSRNPDPEWNRLWCTLDGAGDGKGWTVTGEAPNLTVSPSINCLEPGGWHGHIVNGEISDGSYN
jgi:hypothetical protein